TKRVLRIIPWSLRDHLRALDLPPWRGVLSAEQSAHRELLTTGFMLAFSHSCSDASPPLFTSFGINHFSSGLPRYLLASVDPLPARLYSLAISPYREWHSMGWAAAIVLLALVIVAFVVARVATRQRHQGNL